MKVEMYCVKCRSRKTDPNAQSVTMKNGKPAVKGICPDRGTGMYKIGLAGSAGMEQMTELQEDLARAATAKRLEEYLYYKSLK